MAAKTQKSQPVVRLTIKPSPVTPAQKQAWKRFWQKIIGKTKSEGKNE